MSRTVGRVYEDRARAYLADRGYRILEQNYTTKFGEIDIIAIQDQTLVFVEVKFRKDSSHGKGFEFVTPQKLAKIKRTAWQYIKQHACHLPDQYRLDVVSIDGEEVTLFENVPMA